MSIRPGGPSKADLSGTYALLNPAPDRTYLPATPGIANLGGLDVAPPETMTSNLALSNQRCLFTKFEPSRKFTASGVAFAVDSVAAAATPTTVRTGLYAISEDGQAWPLARSANVPTAMAATMTLVNPTFDASWADTVTLVPGRVYATAIMIDSAAALPSVSASPSLRTVIQQQSRAFLSGAVTDLPTFWSDVFAGTTQVPWSKVRTTPGAAANAARTAVLLGDSFFASVGGWFGLGNAQGNGRLHPVKNSGIGSQTLAQMIARWAADVVAYSPEWVVVHGGVNDLFAEGATSATIISRYQTLISLAAAAGYGLVLTVPPSETVAVGSQQTTLTAVRAFLLGLTQTATLKVADTGIALTTGDGITSNGALLTDTVHPNAAGQAAMAPNLATVIATIT